MTKRFSRSNPLYLSAKRSVRSAFPVLFASPRHPWKIGIWHDMDSVYPELMRNKWVSRYLRDFCRGEKYLRATISGMPRIDINGVIVDDVQEGHKEYARKIMESKR